MDDNIGNRIKSARKKCRLTQIQLADKAFISESYMALIETNKRNPSTDVIIRLAKVLNVSSDYLLFNKQPQNDTTLFNEWKSIMEGRSIKEIESAHEIIKIFFNNIDRHND